MAKIKLSSAAINGIQGTTRYKFNPSPEYQKMMQEADKKIAEDHHKMKVAILGARNMLPR